MARAAFGQLQEFQPDSESVTAYIERATLFFAANDVPEEKQVPVLLSAIGVKTYSLLRNLVAPARPQDKTFEQLVEALKRHFEPQPAVIAERFHFHRRNQHAGESIAEYMAELRRLSTHCQFDATLDQALRDRLVCGLRSEGIQKRLLTETDLTLKRAVELAQGMEAADRNAKSLKGSEAVVAKVTKDPGGRRSTTACRHCGKNNHEARDCRFRDAKCHQCGKTGHIAPVCWSKNQQAKGEPQTKGRRSRRQTAKNAWVAEGESEEEFNLLVLGEKSSRPIRVDICVNGTSLPMEVDTGAAVSLISEKKQKDLFPDIILSHSSIILKTYTGESMAVRGEFSAHVQYGQQSMTLPFLVVEGDGPTLLGRNWMQHIRLDWQRVGVVAQKPTKTLQSLLDTHAALFKEELGTIQPFAAKLKVRPDASPKFHKPRPVPLAIREAIEQELNRLEACGTIKKVSYSEWAAPIVAVPKRDGHFRICGDYKVTINQALEVDQYPLPQPDTLFATLAGGKTFSKIDLSSAYQQLVLDEDSVQYVTVNTHRGLYQYTRLPFGVASAPAMFQQVMDQILQGIPGVICYIDDILVTGTTEAEHLQHLAEVFHRLEKHGVRVKESKCSFMQDSVEYLGHRIDASGLHATKEKLQAVLHSPKPRNVQELRSFLGLLNYYGKFIPNLSTLIHPLNSLLQQGRKWAWTPECAQAFKQLRRPLPL